MMFFAKGPNLAFLVILASLPLNSLCLSIDESLKPKDYSLIINSNNEDADAVGSDSSRDHHIRKRSVLSKDNIDAKVERLNDSHQQLLVHWTGKTSNVFICLARNNWDHLEPSKPPTPSAVYISFDSGTTYKNKTDLFKLDSSTNSYASIDKFSNHPRNQNFIIFVDQHNKVLYVTKDYGENITLIKPNFQPIDILFYPEDPHIFLVHDVNKTLWITRDFGESFNVAQEFVKHYAWSDRWAGTWTDTPTRSLLVQRIEPYSSTKGSTLIALGNLVISDEPNITVEMRNIEEFQKSGDFVFVTKKLSMTHNELYISYRGGDFYKAIFGSEYENVYYHIADVSEVRIMVAVAHNETLSNLYISEVVPKSDYMFRLTLERLFCYFPGKMWKSSWLSQVTEEKFADLHKVKGMRGIYLASQVTKSARSVNLNPEHLQTLITFDWGGEWKPITPPKLDEIGRPLIGCNSSCTLHLTQKFMNLYPFTKTVPILTSTSAPGLIVATGVLGTSLKGPPGVFVSRDAGLTWKKVLREDYMFNFGDHGGIMAAVRNFKGSKTQEIFYSTDEGESWKNFSFIDDQIRVYTLMTEPGENTTTFTLFGSEIKKHGWMIITIDLRGAFKYNCTNEDYKPWSPSGGLKEKKKKSICIMGLQEVYERRTQHSNCYNGRDYDRPISNEPCPCDIEDFECDFGFTRHVASSGCIRNKSITLDPYRIPESCKPGAFFNRTKGYRKIDGDACIGGYEWQYLPEPIPCPFNETSYFLLVTLKKEILRFNLAEPDPTPQVLPVNDLRNVIAIDFDMKNNCLFYADVQRDLIARQCLSGREAPEILVENGLKSVEGLAYDWISKMLYFVDGTTVKIEAIRTDINYSNRMRKTILDKRTLEKPRGIALHPVAGYMFWTDWSALKPCVGRSNLNGSDVQALFVTPIVHWPNGITVDHIAEQIYWVEAKLDYIAAADLHGRHFRKIIQNNRLAHPFSVAVFKDLVYWDDWEKKRIFIADKDHGVSVHSLTEDLEGLMDLKVFAHSMQEGTNACSNSSYVCSHLCFAQPNNKPPVCACPDDMIMKNGECLCIDGSTPFANHTCPKKNGCRKADEFLCGNNSSCIPISWKCNGINNCGDNSDEMGCTFQTCNANEFRCENGHCIPKYWVCDADNDCEKGEDEINCPLKVCQKDQFQCNDKKCISKKWRCDGENDCKDNSDEMNCSNSNSTVTTNCTDKQFRCSDGMLCIPESWVCDGVFDCKDHSDESNCKAPQQCDSAQFQCNITKRCIYGMWRCDGDFDCGGDDRSDEMNCTQSSSTTETPEDSVPCKEFMFKCSENKCIPDWWKCDGVPDCPNHADEIGCHESKKSTTTPSPVTIPENKCSYNEFLCGSGDCIPSAWICDGNSDCSDKSDELNCTTNGVDCPSGYLKCQFSNVCYHSRQACDGNIDCPDHSDERDCANKASTDTHPPGNPCSPGFFKCPEGQCIALSKKCNGRKDCIDGFDENNCENFERVYQVNHINFDLHRRTNCSSIPIIWSIDKPPNVNLEYMPSISMVEPDHSKAVWTNATEWMTGQKYMFTSLYPFSQYNITVYVRLAGRTRVYPPAIHVVYHTTEDIPSPPWNVTVLQKSGDVAEVIWAKPRMPNGIIKEYQLYSTPPLPPMKTIIYPQILAPTYHAFISTHFEPGAVYSFWVVAMTTAGASNNSLVAHLVSERANIGPIKNVDVQCVNGTFCKLSWMKAEGASGYRVIIFNHPPYPKIPPLLINETEYDLTSLSPGVSYKIIITAFHKTIEGQQAISSLTTRGIELPTVANITARVSKQSDGYAVTLTWKAPKSDHYNEHWMYGVYYGTKASELFEGLKMKAPRETTEVTSLEACETYLFDVGVIGPRGTGPLTMNPARITTGYHKSAPPKGLTLTSDTYNETVMVISWNSSCFQMEDPIGYTINLEEMVTGQRASVTLLPTNATNLQHKIITDYGARYKVTVQTNVSNSVESYPVEYWAPLLPTPHQVKVERYHNNTSYLISWQFQPTLQHMPNHDFEVMICEGEEFNESQAVLHRVKFPPYLISDMKPDIPYAVAVRLISDVGYKSPLSEINNVRVLLASDFTDGVSVVSVFLVVFTAVFLILLGTIFGIYAIKTYRLRNSFTSFANSHYSTSSGAAIFTDRLDDEDSPVIRGFSDDEPLVVA